MLFGWDGASWQGRPDVPALRDEGHAFVIEKVTGEGNYINPYWSLVRDDARAAGVVFGGYDWVMPQEWVSDDDARAAARDYLRVLGARQQHELIAVDFEEQGWASGLLGANIESAMRAYLTTLRDESGQTIIFYTAPYFLAETGADGWTWLRDLCVLWLAAPGKDAMLPDDAPWPSAPAPFSATALHQHQWHATSSAVAGEFDRDRFRGSIDDLRALGLPGNDVTGENHAGGGQVIEPVSGKYTAYINDAGEAIVVLNFGGPTPRIDGIRIVDVGVSVESATEPGVILDRSFQGESAQPWHDRRQC